MGPHVDPTIAACIQQLVSACPNLKSLTFHVPSIPALVQLVGLARNTESATVFVLRSLKSSLNRISVTGRGDYEAFAAKDPSPPHAPMGLCTIIAPREEWNAQWFQEWPQTTVREEDFCEENCYRIRGSRNVSDGFVTSTTKAIWGFHWEKSRVGGAEDKGQKEDRIAQENSGAEMLFPVDRHAELWAW